MLVSGRGGLNYNIQTEGVVLGKDSMGLLVTHTRLSPMVQTQEGPTMFH